MKKNAAGNSASGMTLIEVLIASAVLAIAAGAIIASVGSLFKAQSRVRGVTNEDRLVSGLVASIRSNLGLYPISPYQVGDIDPSTNAPYTNTLLVNLPIAYTDTTLIPASQCQGPPDICPPNRIGFAIQPLTGVPGLVQITIRLVNPSLYGTTYQQYLQYQQSKITNRGYRQYQFIASY